MNGSNPILNIRFSWFEWPDHRESNLRHKTFSSGLKILRKNLKCQPNFQQLFQLAKTIWKAIEKQENKKQVEVLPSDSSIVEF